MNSKQISIFLGIAVLILLGVIAYITWGVNPKSETLNQQNNIQKENTINSNTDNKNVNSAKTANTNTKPAATDWKVYKNTDYGFRLNLTEQFKGYYVVKSQGDKWSVNSYRFCIPTTDKNWFSSDCKTGYADPIALTVFTTQQWASQKEQLGVTYKYLGETDKHVVTYSTWQDTPNDIKDADLGFSAIAKSFMFMTY